MENYDLIKTIKKIIRMPELFNKLKKISIYELLNKTGYFEVYDEISVELIQQVLSQVPEYVEDWRIYSENKRANSGYYITQENKNFIVGYFYNNKQLNQNIFTDKIEACSFFIKKEIENIRNNYDKQ